MEAKVDPDTCTACELCTQLCPEVFSMGDGVAVGGPVPPDQVDEAQEAADQCPVECITLV